MQINPNIPGQRWPLILFLLLLIPRSGFSGEDMQGFGVGLEFSFFDQSKVASSFLDDEQDHYLFQVNYIPQLTYSFGKWSMMGLKIDYGKRGLEKTPDEYITETFDTQSAGLGVYYRLRFIHVLGFNAYLQTETRLESFYLKYSSYTTASTAEDHSSLYMKSLRLSSMAFNLRMGAEIRLIKGLHVNIFAANDVAAFNFSAESMDASQDNYSPGTEVNLMGIELVDSEITSSNDSGFSFIRPYIITGIGLRYQF